jgi:hypothetical protein
MGADLEAPDSASALLEYLGEQAADCFVLDDANGLAELWEIDENFARAELTDAQRADHHVRREAILIKRGEVRDAPRGGRPRNGDNLSAYSERAAQDFGVDERTVQRDLRRGKNIDPEVLAEIAGTDNDKGVVLDRLAARVRHRGAPPWRANMVGVTSAAGSAGLPHVQIRVT